MQLAKTRLRLLPLPTVLSHALVPVKQLTALGFDSASHITLISDNAHCHCQPSTQALLTGW